MSGKSWLAINDPFTYQSWNSRPGYFSGFYCVETPHFLLPASCGCLLGHLDWGGLELLACLVHFYSLISFLAFLNS
jgi:hypothetical protein